MTPFNRWWGSSDNPARTLPETTQDQVKAYMRSAFAAGVKSERNKRVFTEADIIEARDMFKDPPL